MFGFFTLHDIYFLKNRLKIVLLASFIILPPDITNLATNASLNTKINEVKGQIPSITNLVTTLALTTVENKKLNVSN